MSKGTSGLILVLSLFLTACQTTTESINEDKALTNGHGLAAVKVINNTDRLSQYHWYWTEVVAFRVDNYPEKLAEAEAKARESARLRGRTFNNDMIEVEYDMVSMMPLKDSLTTSITYSGTMPQGDYQIGLLYSSYYGGDVSAWIAMPVKDMGGTFTVKSNTFTDLGTVVFQPLKSTKEPAFWDTPSDNKAFVTPLRNPPSLAGEVQNKLPIMTVNIDMNEPLTWHSDESDEMRFELSDLAQNNPFGKHNFGLGSLVRGGIVGRFGSARVLDNNEQWSLIQAPTINQLISAMEYKQQIWFGNRNGDIFAWDSEADSWESFKLFSGDESIIWLGEHNQQIYAATRDAKTITVYELDPSTRQSKVIKTINSDRPSKLFVVRGGIFFAITSSGKLRVFDDEKVHEYTPSTATWQTQETMKLYQLEQLDNGILVGHESSNWSVVGDQIVSLDFGNTWQTIDRRTGSITHIPVEDSLPIAFIDGTVISMSRKKGVARKIFITSRRIDNAGKVSRMRFHGEAIPDCQIALPHLSHNKKIYYLCDDGKIVSSTDLGKTWVTEVENNLLDMQYKTERLIRALYPD